MPARRSKTWRASVSRAVALGLGQLGERGLVGDGAPQPGGDVVLLDLLQARGHAGLAEILLRQDVGGDLAELRRHVDVVEAEDDRAVRIPDLARRLAEFDLRIGRLAGLGVTPFDAHGPDPFYLYIALSQGTFPSHFARRMSAACRRSKTAGSPFAGLRRLAAETSLRSACPTCRRTPAGPSKLIFFNSLTREIHTI